MDWLSAGFYVALGYLAARIPWRRRPPCTGADPEILERARHHKTFTVDDIARAAAERMRRARERKA